MKRIFLLLCLTMSFVWAHKINLFITTQKENVEIYSYFANAAPCKGCDLLIKHNETVVLKTVLNSDGKYSFKSQYPSLDIHVSSVGGHAAHRAVVLDHLTKESLKVHQKKEQESNYLKIVLALILIGLVFLLLKRVKK